jgi:hypothetical protein
MFPEDLVIHLLLRIWTWNQRAPNIYTVCQTWTLDLRQTCSIHSKNIHDNTWDTSSFNFCVGLIHKQFKGDQCSLEHKSHMSVQFKLNFNIPHLVCKLLNTRKWHIRNRGKLEAWSHYISLIELQISVAIWERCVYCVRANLSAKRKQDCCVFSTCIKCAQSFQIHHLILSSKWFWCQSVKHTTNSQSMFVVNEAVQIKSMLYCK